MEKIKNLMRYGLDQLIYGDELFQEKHLETIWPREVTKSTDILDLICSYRKDGGFQMVWVAYRILLDYTNYSC